MIFIQQIVCFLSPSLGEGIEITQRDKNHITSQNMGDSFYHIFTPNIHILNTLFFGLRGVGIHNVVSKSYRMSDITLISRKICDKKEFIDILDDLVITSFNAMQERFTTFLYIPAMKFIAM
jgi:hypothetical protein